MIGRFLGDPYRVVDVEKVLRPIGMFSVSRSEVVGELADIDISIRCSLNQFSLTEGIFAPGTPLHLIFRLRIIKSYETLTAIGEINVTVMVFVATMTMKM